VSKISAIDFRKCIAHAWIKCIEADPSGKLWIGTRNGTLLPRKIMLFLNRKVLVLKKLFPLKN